VRVMGQIDGIRIQPGQELIANAAICKDYRETFHAYLDLALGNQTQNHFSKQ